jgi:tetratricopeptide (TPR) repeat protein
LFHRTIRKAILNENDPTRSFNFYLEASQFTKNPQTLIKIEYRKAWCLEKVGNHNEAIKIIHNILKIFNNYSDSYLAATQFYIKLSFYKEAKKILNEGQEKFPNCLDIYLNLAYLLRKMERSDESIEILKKAIQINKPLRSKNGFKRNDLWNELGTMYYDRGHYNTCILCFKQSLLISESQFNEYYLLAKSYLKINDPYHALEFLERYFKKYDLNETNDFILLARIYCKLNRYEDAKNTILDAYKIEDRLIFNSEEMVDLADLTKSGFFQNFESIEIIEE